jgi:hypothetical protein
VRKSSVTPSPNLPPVDFWENDLEIPAANLLAAAQKPDYIRPWVKRRSPTEISVLRVLIGLPIAIEEKGRTEELLQYAGALRPFVPVALFGLYRSTDATIEVANGCLSQELRQLAADGDGKYGKNALLFAIYDYSLKELEKVLLLHKLHTVGLARMKLAQTPRRPKEGALLEFLRSDSLKKVLKDFDQNQQDDRRCTLRGVLERQGGFLVYIRRPHKEDQLLIEDRLRHGHKADWMVLEFREDGRFLNVASHGKNASFEIANRIASAFYRRECVYMNIEEITYPAKLEKFLGRLAKNEAAQLVMVAVGLREPPLPGFETLGGSNTANRSVGPGILELQRLLRTRLLTGEYIERFTVLYDQRKRVRFRIDRLEDTTSKHPGYVVRYRDRDVRLTERPEFEKLFEREHGFKIVSTEKRKSKKR